MSEPTESFSSEELLEKLAAPFPPSQVKWRVGSTSKDKTRGLPLAYVDARLVMQRFDDVLGINWQTKIEETPTGRVICSIGVYVQADIFNEWVWKSDGAGATDFEGDKGGISDAFKRAAVLWGVGRYLYAVKAPWVELVKDGRAIADHELDRLRALLPGVPEREESEPEAANEDEKLPERECSDEEKVYRFAVNHIETWEWDTPDELRAWFKEHKTDLAEMGNDFLTKFKEDCRRVAAKIEERIADGL